ncbi:hypothetical protein [Nocardiopsis alba]|uniref:hypothetical protein n=1 Tax=Nocardiopsis alba TaxID=53437 RepID=UPI0033D634D2
MRGVLVTIRRFRIMLLVCGVALSTLGAVLVWDPGTTMWSSAVRYGYWGALALVVVCLLGHRRATKRSLHAVMTATPTEATEAASPSTSDPHERWNTALRWSLALLAVVAVADGFDRFGATTLPPATGPEAFPALLGSFATALASSGLAWALPTPTPSREPLTRISATLAGAVAAALVIVLLGATITTLHPVHHTVAEVGGEPSPAPESVSRAWTWTAPDDETISDVFATETGALVVLTNGVVALDTRSGKTSWHYLRPGGEVSATVDEQGTTVLITSWDGAKFVREATEIVLDTATGEPLSDQDRNPGLPSAGATVPQGGTLTHGGVLLHPGLDDDLLDFRDPSGKDVLWEYPKAECAFSLDHGGHASTGQWEIVGDRVVLSVLCGAGTDALADSTDDTDIDLTETLIGVDVATGEEIWRVDAHGSPGFAEKRSDERSVNAPPLSVSGDGDAVSIDGSLVVDPESGEILHQGTTPLWTEDGGPYEPVDFTADSYILEQCPERVSGTHSCGPGATTHFEERTWRGELLRATTRAEEGPAPVVALDGAVVIGSTAPSSEKSGHAVQVLPWGQGLPEVIELDDFGGPYDGLLVPGAVILRSQYSDTTIVGLN